LEERKFESLEFVKVLAQDKMNYQSISKTNDESNSYCKNDTLRYSKNMIFDSLKLKFLN
jgi:hypothetical protein